MRNDYVGSCYSTLAYPTLTTADVITLTTPPIYEDITTTTSQYSPGKFSYSFISLTTSMPSLAPTLVDGLIPALGACDYASKATIVNTLPTTAVTHVSKQTTPETRTLASYSIAGMSCSDTAFIYEAYSDSAKKPLPSFVVFDPATLVFTFNS